MYLSKEYMSKKKKKTVKNIFNKTDGYRKPNAKTEIV